jgi:hypothetical protein
LRGGLLSFGSRWRRRHCPSASKSTADSQRLHSDRSNRVSLCRLNGKLWITALFAKSDKSTTH